MGQPLLINQLILRALVHIDRISRCLAAPCAGSVLTGIVAVSLLLSVGCQTSAPLSRTAIPVPPPTLTTDQLDNVRFQSPGSTTTQSPGSTTRQSPGSTTSQIPDYGPTSQDHLFNEKTYSPQQASDLKPASVDRSKLVADVIFTGNRYIQTHQLARNIRTRPGRYFDPDKLKQDVDQLWAMPEIRRIGGPYLKKTRDGVIVTINVEERNAINTVEFIGNRGITDKQLQKTAGIEDGDPLDVHAIRMAKTRIEDYYKEKGFPSKMTETLFKPSGDDRN